MKSKISCFNKTIFKKNVTHFWPIWLVYMGYLVFALPVNLWLNMANYNGGMFIHRRRDSLWRFQIHWEQ